MAVLTLLCPKHWGPCQTLAFFISEEQRDWDSPSWCWTWLGKPGGARVAKIAGVLQGTVYSRS